MKCVLCGHDGDEYRVVHEEWFERKDVECNACGLIQADPMPSEDALKTYYAGPYRKERPAVLTHYPFDPKRPFDYPPGAQRTLCPRFIARRVNRMRLRYELTAASAVYEHGCGAGWTAFSLSALTGAKTDGVDIDLDMEAEARALGVGHPAGTYDLAHSVHVMEHLRDPMAHIHMLAGWSHRVQVEVPGIHDGIDWQWAHLTHWNENTLYRLLKEAGLRNVFVEQFDAFLIGGGSV